MVGSPCLQREGAHLDIPVFDIREHGSILVERLTDKGTEKGSGEHDCAAIHEVVSQRKCAG